MKRTRLIIVGVALAAGLTAAYLSSGTHVPAPAPVIAAVPEKIAADEVLVAARDLPVGSRLGPQDLKWLAWPAEGLGSGLILRKSEPNLIAASVGAVVREGFVVNEPVRKEKLIK